MSMNGWSRVTNRGGLLATGLGAVGCLLLFLQPWKSCLEDDSSAGCPASMLEANLIVVSCVILLLGLAAWIYSMQGAHRQIEDDK